jgi:hypothetical protein
MVEIKKRVQLKLLFDIQLTLSNYNLFKGEGKIFYDFEYLFSLCPIET